MPVLLGCGAVLCPNTLRCLSWSAGGPRRLDYGPLPDAARAAAQHQISKPGVHKATLFRALNQVLAEAAANDIQVRTIARRLAARPPARPPARATTARAKLLRTPPIICERRLHNEVAPRPCNLAELMSFLYLLSEVCGHRMHCCVPATRPFAASGGDSS